MGDLLQRWWICTECGSAFYTGRAEGQWCANGHRAKLVSRVVPANEIVDIDGHHWRGRWWMFHHGVCDSQPEERA